MTSDIYSRSSKSGLLFFNTLTRRASATLCEVALSMPPGRSPKEIAARGNKSKIDIDWMIGLDQIDNDGVDVDGGGTAIFPQRREWA